MQFLADLWQWSTQVGSSTVLFIGVVFATVGWLYTARRQRTVMRKQHTFNAIMEATFNEKYQKALDDCRPHIREGKFPNLDDDENAQLRHSIRFLMNHYEFLAAGIRNGDIHENLLKDSERGTVTKLFETSDDSGFVVSVRDQRKRRSIFEHMEWLYERWEEKPVPWWQKAFEMLIGRPLYYHASRWILLGVILTLIISILAYAVIVHV